MSNPFSGIWYLLAGFQLIFKPGLKRFVLIPFLLNFILFVGMFFLLRHFMQDFNAWFNHFLPPWLQWLSNLLWLLFFICFFLFFIYTFVIFANFIAAPFNSLLAEKVERYLTGENPANDNGVVAVIADVPRAMRRQLAMIAYYLPRLLVLLLLIFVPLIQIFSPLLWFGFNAWFMTLTYLDYPTDNHRVSFEEMRLWLRPRFIDAMSLGSTILIATMIPILNFFIMPAAVAAATKFWVEESRYEKTHRKLKVR